MSNFKTICFFSLLSCGSGVNIIRSGKWYLQFDTIRAWAKCAAENATKKT